mmetsp:Transcript_10000/g.14971  ORF Transcript_10000/g.14971 Transcript_10000/m.14971 type:complete len:201 (-) Transcript_10000:243-845(-)
MKQRRSTMSESSGGRAITNNPFFDIARKGGNSMIIGGGQLPPVEPPPHHDDTINYALLVALYTLQGIPMGLSASIPFLIQQKVKVMAEAVTVSSVVASTAASAVKVAGDASTAAAAASATKMAYNAQAIFALCSWPFFVETFMGTYCGRCLFQGVWEAEELACTSSVGCFFHYDFWQRLCRESAWVGEWRWCDRYRYESF